MYLHHRLNDKPKRSSQHFPFQRQTQRNFQTKTGLQQAMPQLQEPALLSKLVAIKVPPGAQRQPEAMTLRGIMSSLMTAAIGAATVTRQQPQPAWLPVRKPQSITAACTVQQQQCNHISVQRRIGRIPGLLLLPPVVMTAVTAGTSVLHRHHNGPGRPILPARVNPAVIPMSIRYRSSRLLPVPHIRTHVVLVLHKPLLGRPQGSQFLSIAKPLTLQNPMLAAVHRRLSCYGSCGGLRWGRATTGRSGPMTYKETIDACRPLLVSWLGGWRLWCAPGPQTQHWTPVATAAMDRAAM